MKVNHIIGGNDDHRYDEGIETGKQGCASELEDLLLVHNLLKPK